MGKVVFRGEIEVVVEHEPHGFDGRGAITIKWPPGIKYRMTLSEAESVGEMLVEIVRRAERNTPSR